MARAGPGAVKYQLHFADILQSVQTLGISAAGGLPPSNGFTPIGKGPQKGMNAQERGTFSPTPAPHSQGQVPAEQVSPVASIARQPLADSFAEKKGPE
jgi:hypothetical protein